VSTPLAQRGTASLGAPELKRTAAPAPETAAVEQLAPVPTVLIHGVKVAAMTEVAAVQRIIAAAVAECGWWTITANLDHVRRYRREQVARELIDRADLILADGAPLIWASRCAGTRLPERVAGSDLIWSISAAASERDVSVFLLGGNPGVADKAADVLRDHYPDLRVAGTLCPPFGFDEDPDELDRIRGQLALAAPQIVFVALGFPKQDLLIEMLRPVLPHAAFIGVGMSLGFVSGETARAPLWTQERGLEWLYRLLQEPRRLGKRYLAHGIPFALRLLASATRYRLAAPERGRWGRI